MSNSSGSATAIAGNGKVVTELLDREVDAKVLKSAINGALIEGGSLTGRTVTSTLRISPSPVPSLAFIVIKSSPLKLRLLCTNIMHFFHPCKAIGESFIHEKSLFIEDEEGHYILPIYNVRGILHLLTRRADGAWRAWIKGTHPMYWRAWRAWFKGSTVLCSCM